MKVVHNKKNSKKQKSNKNSNCREKNSEIEKLIKDFCKVYLDEKCEGVCLKIKKDLLKKNQDIYCRGKSNIWAASIIWDMSRVNFLIDSFEFLNFDFDSLCEYFDTKKSTVGSKASTIRKTLDISYLNDDYLVEDSPMLDFLSGLMVTPEGFIVNKGFYEEEIEFNNDIPEFEEVQNYYFDAVYSSKLGKSELMQLDYLLDKKSKEFIARDGVDREIYFEELDSKTISVYANCSLLEMQELADFIKKYGFRVL
ncbi:MAG TPA: hypothetical protein ENK91_15330 [Bacteroidetes bacterium]|nr:hypothetical protein [Bacteroidota bacterium]